MSSYLSQFNYQFLTGEGQRLSLDELPTRAAGFRRWVFLHGLMGYGLNWQRIVKSLGPGQVSLIFDQRGHGQSFKPESGYTPADYAEDLYKIAKEIGWDKFILVGHSMGGRNAIIFAHEHPEMLEKLVIEDIGPEARRKTSYYDDLFAAIPTPFPNKKAAKEFFMNEFRNVPVNGDRETTGLYFYSNIVDKPDGTADWRFSKEAILESVRRGRDTDHWAEFKAIQVPTLVIRGGDSEDLPLDVFQEMAVVNPVIQAVQIDNAGHWVHYNQPEAFVEALKSFANDEVF